MPSGKHAIPKSTAKQNLKKGGSDVTTNTLELCPVNLPVNSAQAEAIARDTMICNKNILRVHHIITSEGKIYASMNGCEDACKHHMSAKECTSKISDIFLGSVTSGESENELTTLNQINYSSREGSSVKSKLEWSAEETGGTPKKNVDQCYSKHDGLKSQVYLKSTTRRRGCAGFWDSMFALMLL